MLIAGQEGKSEWNQNRKNAVDMMEFVRNASATIKANVATIFGCVASIREPFP